MAQTGHHIGLYGLFQAIGGHHIGSVELDQYIAMPIQIDRYNDDAGVSYRHMSHVYIGNIG